MRAADVFFVVEVADLLGHEFVDGPEFVHGRLLVLGDLLRFFPVAFTPQLIGSVALRPTHPGSTIKPVCI